jgi:ubiquinone/menaquinone biosynthesis C-methylase UbiE
VTDLEALASAFDRVADHYDRFTEGVIGGVLRSTVHARLRARCRPGDRILEINCGTGEDALFLAQQGCHVVATDLSAGMLAVARRKVEAAGASDRVELSRMAIEAIDAQLGTFDGLLSSFGGLNCVASLAAAMPRLAARVRPGGFAVCSIMGPAVPWEWAWFLAQGRPGEAFRRFRRDGVDWRGIRVRYPSIGTTTRAAAPWFVRRRVAALGCLVPPSYVEGWATRHRRGVAWLAGIERLIGTVRPLPDLSDHYLLELERTAAPAGPVGPGGAL